MPKQEKTNVNVGKNKKGLSWVLLTLAVIYILSPIDIVPDFLPILGWLDDFLVGALALINFINQQKKG